MNKEELTAEQLEEKVKSAIFNTLVVTNKDSFKYTWKYLKPILEEYKAQQPTTDTNEEEFNRKLLTMFGIENTQARELITIMAKNTFPAYPSQPTGQSGYSKESIANFTPVEKAAFGVISEYEPRDAFVIDNKIWPTYDQYTVLEMLCNFRAKSQQPTTGQSEGEWHLRYYPCDSCGGDGMQRVNDGSQYDCPDCDGSGKKENLPSKDYKVLTWDEVNSFRIIPVSSIKTFPSDITHWKYLINPSAVEQPASQPTPTGEGEWECVAGCKTFTGNETKHHKDCPFYEGSLSQQFDELTRLKAAPTEGEQLTEFVKTLKDDAIEQYKAESNNEEAQAVYANQNMVCEMILKKIEELYPADPIPTEPQTNTKK